MDPTMQSPVGCTELPEMMRPLIEVRSLKKYFPLKRGVFRRKEHLVKAVDGVTFDVYPRETLALVGESGCGKTTLARVILGLTSPTEGTVKFMGKDLDKLEKHEMKKIRRDIQIVFQNPYASLNPRQRIEQILSLPLKTHHISKKEDIKKRVKELLEQIGLSPADQYLDKHPHELSGGQRQRIGIARAIALNPKIIICDEPVSALDMSVRGQILNLLKQLQADYGLTYIFITHDLTVVRTMAARVATMYLGKIVELATEDLFANPLSPYTQALMNATPRPNPRITRSRKRLVITGEVSSPIDPPTGCRFHPRCPIAMEVCSKVDVPLEETRKNHWVACHAINRDPSHSTIAFKT